MVWLWVAVGVVLIIIEIAAGTYYFLALATASLLTALLAWLWIDGIWGQLAAMAVLSVASMFAVTSVLQKLNRKSEGYENDTTRIVGERGTVIREIAPEYNGVVKLSSGAEWTARSGERLPVGSVVTVTGIEGTIAVGAAIPEDRKF